MKALVFDKAGPAIDVLQAREVAEPRVGPDDILIAIRARAVLPSDHMFVQGSYRWKPVFPQIAGLEGVGEILSCGKDVDPALGLTSGRIVAFRSPGTWAERIAVRAEAALTLPDGLSWTDASQLHLNSLTAWGLLETAGVKAGETVMANAGASSVSHWLAAFSRTLGATFFCSVRSAESRSRAPRSAAKVFTEEEPLRGDRELEKLRVYFDSVGGESARRGLEALMPGGLFLAYGIMEKDLIPFTTSLLIYRDIRLRGFGFQAWRQAQPRSRLLSLLEQAAGMLRSGLVELPQPSVFSLESFREALATGRRIVFAG